MQCSNYLSSLSDQDKQDDGIHEVTKAQLMMKLLKVSSRWIVYILSDRILNIKNHRGLTSIMKIYCSTYSYQWRRVKGEPSDML